MNREDLPTPGFSPIPKTAVEITDGHLTMLRSYLSEDAERTLVHVGGLRDADVQGFGLLVYAAFEIAARRRFRPPTTRADLIRYVADVRQRTITEDDLEPLTCESVLLSALGVSDDRVLDDLQQTRSRIFLLEAMVEDSELGFDEVGELLSEARTLATERGGDRSAT